MKKILSTFLVFIILQTINAQRTIDGLIKAEKDFATFSVANGTKDAFLKFLDSAGIIFDNGKAVNGFEASNKRENGPGVLNWQPQFAEIANSNDFGYTTGPWTFQASAKDTIVARGQYTTVWHLNANGEWKFLVDLGVNNIPVNLASEIKKINVPKYSGKTKYIPHQSSQSLAESGFIRLFHKSKAKAYSQYLSKESILTRHKFGPAIDKKEQQMIIDSTSSAIRYNGTWGEGMGGSRDEDMFYAYGSAVLNGKTENYLRIWRLEKGGWKIALEVLRY
jgi:hypothetical protein